MNDFERATIVNVNLGGDNTNRAVLIGLILGAVHGTNGIPSKWKSGLHNYQSINELIQNTVQFIRSSSAKITGLFESNNLPDLRSLVFQIPTPSKTMKGDEELFFEACNEDSCIKKVVATTCGEL
jgi:hypothetical protein